MLGAMRSGILVGLTVHRVVVGNGKLIGHLMQPELQHARHGEHLADRSRFKGLADGPRHTELGLITACLNLIAVGKRQDIAGLDVLNHGDSPSGLVFLPALLEHLFDVPLHVMVDGEGDVRTIDGILGFGHGPRNLDTAVAPLVDLVAILAGERLVFHLFDAGHTLAVIVDPTQQRAHQGAVGIDALVAQLGIDDTAQIQFADLTLDRRRHVLFQYGILAGSRQLGSEFGRVHAEHRRQQTCHGGCTRGADRFAIDLMAVVTGLFRAGGRYEGLRLLGISDNGVAFHALRQNRPVGVEDLATPSLQRHRDGAALRGGLCHVLAVDQLHIGQLDQACAGQNRQYDADGHGLRQQVPVEYRVDASDELH